MKECRKVNISILLFLVTSIFIFTSPLLGQTDTAHYFSLQVSCNKTTSVIFPQIIKSIDRGSTAFLVQKVNGVENVLQVKAATENFAESNMTVITADGKLYAFTIRYSADPAPLNMRLDNTASIVETIARQKKIVHGARDVNYQMILRLKGLYIQHEILYCQLDLENLSNLSYDIDLLRFYIKDKKQSRRTASQELEQLPMTVYGNTGSVAAQSRQIMVVALPKFTIPDKKHFYIQVMEKNGGRNLRLKISNRKLVRARILSDDVSKNY